MTLLKRTTLLPTLGWIFLVMGGALHLMTGCHSSSVSLTRSSSAHYRSSQVSKNTTSFSQTGYASWYGKKFQGRRTASGAIYNMHALTAAHRKLPFNTYVHVTNLENNKQVIVQINDRGPFGIFRRRRVIDLSYAAARALDMHKQGHVRVLVQAISAKEAGR